MQLSRSHLALAAGTALLGGLVLSGAAQAYPAPLGAASGSCTPAVQNDKVGGGGGSAACTFTFTKADGTPVKFQAVTWGISGDGTQGVTGTATDSNGQATVHINLNDCASASTPLSATATASIDGSQPGNTPAYGPKATAQASAGVSCQKGDVTVTAGSPVYTSTTSFMATSYDCGTLSFTTSAADGTSVSYSAGAHAFAFSGSTTVSGGAFSTSFCVESAFHGTSSVRGFVADTSDYSGGNDASTV